MHCHNFSGEIQEVFELAAKKTAEISPGQEPMLYRSKRVDRILMRPQGRKQQANRAIELLNSSADLYSDKSWDKFLVAVERSRVLALDSAVQQRSTHEADWVRLVMSAEDLEKKHKWAEAAELWQKSSLIFPARQWVAIRAAVAWLMADHLDEAVETLSPLAQTEGQLPQRAKEILGELLKTFPELAAKARNGVKTASKPVGKEFELVEVKE